MVVAEEKPLEEIIEMIKPYKKILNTGCAGCTAVCLAGGQREVDRLSRKLEAHAKENGTELIVDSYTLERQCDMNFLCQLDSIIEKYDAVLSMACGAGVQFIAERFPNIPVLPAVNTTFIGVNRDIGWYEERCRSCGDCQLAYTGGICPVTMCAKSLFNGPCGGSQDARCEVNPDIPCAWCMIYERLKEQGRLDNIMKIKAPMQWKNQVRGVVIQKEYKNRYTDTKQDAN